MTIERKALCSADISERTRSGFETNIGEDKPMLAGLGRGIGKRMYICW